MEKPCAIMFVHSQHLNLSRNQNGPSTPGWHAPASKPQRENPLDSDLKTSDRRQLCRLADKKTLAAQAKAINSTTAEIHRVVPTWRSGVSLGTGTGGPFNLPDGRSASSARARHPMPTPPEHQRRQFIITHGDPGDGKHTNLGHVVPARTGQQIAGGDASPLEIVR
jgi:hypothetical protein